MFSSTKIMQALSPAAAAPSSYQISRSLRFNSADSAYLTRTPGSTTNQKTYTWSGWVKRGTLGAGGCMFGAGSSGTNFCNLVFSTSTDTLSWFTYEGSTSTNLDTTQVFRDVSSWYHIVLAVDTTQATSSNRAKLYVNGVQITAFGTATYPSQNTNNVVNTSGVPCGIGAQMSPGAAVFFNGYMAEVNFIDGQQLTPSSFGQTDSATGVWNPIAYTGTYGTNGFYLNFSDNSGTTSTTLGKDSSGNSNNWTPNNFSVTAGVGNDSLVDTPTNYGTDTGVGGEVRGNYCTWNAISNTASGLANGNLDLTASSPMTRANSTIAVSSGKWYYEIRLNTAGTNSSAGIGQNFVTNSYPGYDALSYSFEIDNARIANNDVLTSYGSACTAGDTFMCAIDLDNNKIFFGKNGTWFNSSNPVTGASPAFSITAGTYCAIARPYGGSAAISANFGQRPFAYTAPSGYKALCTQNLPTPAIGATSSTLASKNMNIALYTGNGSTLAVTGLGFSPDFVWVKSRSSAGKSHVLYDRVRGNYSLFSDNTSAEIAGYLASLDSDGFTTSVTPNDTANTNGTTYVGWTWKAGGTAVTNTAGSISSQVSANPTAGISVVTYTGTGTAATIGHGLGIAPKVVIIKSRSDSSTSWIVYHSSISPSNLVTLQTTGAQQALPLYFNSTATTSTVFSIGSAANSGSDLNVNTKNYVAYCFAEVAGFSKFDSYIGNGSADGPFVYCGFRPRYVCVKQTSGGGGSWELYDTERNTYNVANLLLEPNSSGAETTASGYVLDFLSNGFKLRGTGSGINTSSATYIFMAFAESPFNYSRAR